MKSIQKKIVVLQVISIICCTLGVGAIGIFCVQKLVDSSNNKIGQLIAENEGHKIDTILSNIQQAVDFYAVRTLEEFPVPEGTSPNDTNVSLRLSNDKVLQGITDRIMQTEIHSANMTDGTVSVYLRYNPELANPKSGFYLEHCEDNTFKSLETTDLSLYEKGDLEHVGWYYLPAETKKPLWMEPYENLSLSKTVVSYVVPIILGETIIGVVGMDLSMDFLVEAVKDISLFESGYAYLVSSDEIVLYHPTVAAGNKLVREKDWDYNISSLSNGMKIVTTVPDKELYAERNRTFLFIALMTVGILVVFVVISILVASAIIRPLKKLNKVASKFASGDTDVELNIKSDDEVGELAKSFKKTSENLKHYIEYINGLAYRDSLTGVKNKTSYDSSVKQLNLEIKQESDLKFGIVYFDVNGLKTINDTLGLDYGNLLLAHCCRHICQIFSHSPVFRIGGDEFVAILRKSDYENRNMLLRNFETQMKLISNKAQEPYQKISIAFGMAEFDPVKDHGVEVVLNRAEVAMYEKKKEMKSFN